MNRKQFLKCMGTAALAATGAASAAFHSKRTVHEWSGELSAPPEAVFPLLCPIREYEWLDTWSCDLIYSKSGVAEENCIFRTPHGPAMWNVDHYEPPKRISFTVISPEQVSRLIITLEPTAAGGTKVYWHRMFSGLNEAGNAKKWDVEIDRALMRKLDFFLKTGRMLRESQRPA